MLYNKVKKQKNKYKQANKKCKYYAMKPSNQMNNKTRKQMARTGMLRTIEYVKEINKTKGIRAIKHVKDENKTSDS